MTTLVITDIPRISALFERIAGERGDLVVVGEIHRGIELLDRYKPGLIILQNHLSGLSADIVHKHLKSRLNRRRTRFALISPSESLDVELSARFETILDPSLSDERLEQVITTLLLSPERPPRGMPASSILELPLVAEQEPELPGLQPDSPAVSGDLNSLQDSPAPAVLPLTTSSAAEAVPEPATYERPRRANISIISAFSQHLDDTAEELHPRPARISPRDEALAIRDLHREPHLVTDQEPVRPFSRRTAVWLLAATIVLVLIITLIQQRPAPKQAETPDEPVRLPAETSPQIPAPPAVGTTALPSHGLGRPKQVPSFIPADSIDPAYSKDNPGWESYHGQAYEYRVFREQDGAIKAIQLIDRSGAGIQDAFYVSVLKELAGVTAMRPTSSEIKEGYEIRRGTVAGLELIQYRDAQGGRLRGFVVTWP